MSPLWNVYDVSLRIARSNEADRMVTAHFMFLAAFPLSMLLPQDLSHSRLKMERLHKSAKIFWAWLKLIILFHLFFFSNANAPLGGPACFIGFDVHFWTSRRQRNYGCQTNAGSRSCNDAKWHDQAERPKNERVCHPRAVVCGLVDLSRKHKQHLLAASKLLPTQTTGCFLLVLKCLV